MKSHYIKELIGIVLLPGALNKRSSYIKIYDKVATIVLHNLRLNNRNFNFYKLIFVNTTIYVAYVCM